MHDPVMCCWGFYSKLDYDIILGRHQQIWTSSCDQELMATGVYDMAALMNRHGGQIHDHANIGDVLILVLNGITFYI